jgi:hypothetical protein
VLQINRRKGRRILSRRYNIVTQARGEKAGVSKRFGWRHAGRPIAGIVEKAPDVKVFPLGRGFD